MAGIYVHIPFCKKSCFYCDFYFSTSLKRKKEVLDAILKEIELRKNELKETVSSIYFGGGTPSLLSKEELDALLQHIFNVFKVERNPEITLEANPDDLNSKKIKELKEAGINRLSIGVQSFRNEDLQWMNRVHTNSQALSCIKNSQDEGLTNISLDLIYGFPSLTQDAWATNLEQAFNLHVNHLSCYSLTVEPQTPLSYFIKKGKYTGLNEELAVAHFKQMLKMMEEKDWLQYEISNFCKKGYFSKHNTSYWRNEPYLGLGPSAHSFNGQKRRWNLANNKTYISGITLGLKFYNEEIISNEVSYNEYILTALRTIWGCDLAYIEQKYGEKQKIYFSKLIKKFVSNRWVLESGHVFTLSNEGKLFADHIASELMIVHQ